MVEEQIVQEKVEKKKRVPKPHACVLDMDDCIVNFLPQLCHFHNSVNGTCISDSDIKQWNFDNINVKDAKGRVVTGADLRSTFHEWEPKGLYACLPIIPEARNALKFMHDMGYKVIIITARKPEYEGHTRANMISNDIRCDEIYFERDKVKKIKELKKIYNITLFADDNLDTVKAVADNCNIGQVYLVSKSHNESAELDDDIIRVKTVFDVCRSLKEIK